MTPTDKAVSGFSVVKILYCLRCGTYGLTSHRQSGFFHLTATPTFLIRTAVTVMLSAFTVCFTTHPGHESKPTGMAAARNAA